MSCNLTPRITMIDIRTDCSPNLICVHGRHAAIADYMFSAGFETSLAAFTGEAGVEEVTASSVSNLLEKKWTSVVRLQKKVGWVDAFVFVSFDVLLIETFGTD